jgi:GH35 family endo-1,4-beta-xylanase
MIDNIPSLRALLSRATRHAALFLALLAGVPSLPAQPAMPPLAPELQALQPVSLLGPEPLRSARVRSGQGVSPAAEHRWDDATRVLRIETFTRSTRSWDVELSLPSQVAVQRGDVALVRFQIRALAARQESQEGVVVCYFQQSSAPHTKSLNQNLSVGPDWTIYVLPLQIGQDLPARGSNLGFSLGTLEQTIELRDVEVLNFGPRAQLAQMPRTRFTYAGREADAPWRREALARIEKLRTAPLRVAVQDGEGRPLANAWIEARLVVPGFPFGTAVDANIITGRRLQADTETYKAKVLELFSGLVFDNNMKWSHWSGSSDARRSTLDALDWAKQAELTVRGHTLVWPSYRWSPRWLRESTGLKERLAPMIDAQIEDILGATRGRIVEWDAINEPMHETEFFDILGEQAPVGWLKLARRLDPRTKIIVNDYAMLNSSNSPDKIREFLALIRRWQQAGAPIDGLGVQGHIGGQMRPPEDVLRDLDLFQEFGLPVRITEFDINITDEELQADYTRDFLIACYSHPIVVGFTKWGFWEGHHWKPDAAMFRKDWSEKPNGKVWRDLVVNQWRTQLEGRTDAKGEFAGRGHLGLYEITVTSGGKTTRQRVQLAADRGEALVTLR